MTQGNAKQLVKFLKAVANPRRLNIVQLLTRNRHMTVSTVAESIKLSFRSTSHHLRLLRAANIVDSEQRGLEVYYRLDPDTPYADLLHKISAEL